MENLHIPIIGGSAAMVGISGVGVPGLLTRNVTFYVRTDGNDANDGTEDNAAHAFRTGSRAYKEACEYHLMAGAHITIQLGNGVFDPIICAGAPAGSLAGDNPFWMRQNHVAIKGKGAANTSVVKGAGTSPMNACILATGGAMVEVFSLKVGGNGAGNGLIASDNGVIDVWDGVEFGAVASHQICAFSGGKLFNYSSYAVSGGGQSHMNAWGSGHIEGGVATVTFTGTPAFSLAYAMSQFGASIFNNGSTWVGSFTGKRFQADQGGIIITDNGNLDYFPGTLPGTLSSGGRYEQYAANELPLSFTVAGLGSAATAGAGTRAFVTDATAATFGSTVVGGGALKVPVFSDGAAWKVG